jgi:succinate-semialdehyde dehydrogenase/glutarate-semialdehyde dehydrogenase
VGAGRSVAELAGKHIKKTVLELGGSDAFIVMPGADLPKAVEAAVQARCINNGQSCIAAKRFILHEVIAEEFEERFVRSMSALKVGDPMEEDTNIGPLATDEVRQLLERQVSRTVALGARVLLGGARLQRTGYFHAPTVLSHIPPGAPAAEEELFGPVASLFRVKNIEEAVAIANSTAFGLGASAWTSDAAERNTFINELEAGSVFINAMVASDPRAPFGGVKDSGYGRELGREGIREFLNIKTVRI